MIISSLSLNKFRNHTKKSFVFSPYTTVILGENGAGKTNILEAIFMLATGKSFRADMDREMISFEMEMSRVTSIIKSDEEKKLEILLTTGSVTGVKTPYKKFLVNGVGKRMVDFVGTLKVVLFWPQDLELVTGSPSLRRKYLDFVLLQTDREYRRCLLSYERGLRQRNRLLEAIRDQGSSRTQLLFWDQLLIKDGTYISNKRNDYIAFLNAYKSGISRYKAIYDPSIISAQRLEEYKMQEVASANTLVGPHRDDFSLEIKEVDSDKKRDLSRFGSRGEQRLGILWLKLGELGFIEKNCQDKAVLLLDDIFSELDHQHRAIIFDLINDQQTVMSVADEHFVNSKSLQNVTIVKV